MTELTIREYRERDWDRICAIHDAARHDELRGSVDPAVWRPLAEVAAAEGLFDSRIWVGEIDHQVVGWVAATPDEITWLYVDPAWYRRGIASRLLRHAIAQGGPVLTVMVLAGNAGARTLYEREGFVLDRLVTLRFSEGEGITAEGAIYRLDREV